MHPKADINHIGSKSPLLAKSGHPSINLNVGSGPNFLAIFGKDGMVHVDLSVGRSDRFSSMSIGERRDHAVDPCGIRLQRLQLSARLYLGLRVALHHVR